MKINISLPDPSQRCAAAIDPERTGPLTTPREYITVRPSDTQPSPQADVRMLERLHSLGETADDALFDGLAGGRDPPVIEVLLVGTPGEAAPVTYQFGLAKPGERDGEESLDHLERLLRSGVPAGYDLTRTDHSLLETLGLPALRPDRTPTTAADSGDDSPATIHSDADGDDSPATTHSDADGGDADPNSDADSSRDTDTYTNSDAGTHTTSNADPDLTPARTATPPQTPPTPTQTPGTRRRAGTTRTAGTTQPQGRTPPRTPGPSGV